MDFLADLKTRLTVLVTIIVSGFSLAGWLPEAWSEWITANGVELVMSVLSLLALFGWLKVDREGRRAEQDPRVPPRKPF